MLSDFQSAPIQGIGGRLKNGGHPAPPVGEFADQAEWPPTEGAELRREVPSEGLRLRLVVLGRNSPVGGGSPIWGPPPHRPPSATAADGNGNWGRTTRGEFLPESFSAVFRPCSQLIGVSADELLGNRVEGPGFSNRPLPASPPFASIAALSSLRSLHWAEGSPLCPSPPFFVHFRGGHRRFPRFYNRGRTGSPAPPSAAGANGNGNWGRDLGETRSPSPLPPFSVDSRSSSAFPPMSCLKIRVRGPEFLNPPAPPHVHRR